MAPWKCSSGGMKSPDHAASITSLPPTTGMLSRELPAAICTPLKYRTSFPTGSMVNATCCQAAIARVMPPSSLKGSPHPVNISRWSLNRVKYWDDGKHLDFGPHAASTTLEGRGGRLAAFTYIVIVRFETGMIPE